MKGGREGGRERGKEREGGREGEEVERGRMQRGRSHCWYPGDIISLTSLLLGSYLSSCTEL